MRGSGKEIAVGVMFFVGLVSMFVTAIWVAGSTLGFGQEYNLFTVQFDTVAGVESGTSVFFNGVQKGKVKEVRIDVEQSRALMDIALDADVRISHNAEIEIQQSLFGNRTIQIIDDNPSEASWKPSDTIPGAALPDPYTEVARIIGGVGEVVKTTKSTVDELHLAIAAMNDREEGGVIAMILHDPEFAERVQGMITNFSDAAQSFNEVGDNINIFFEQTLQQGEGILPRLLYDAQMAQNVEQAIQDLANVSSNADGVMQDIRALTSSLRQQEGILGAAIGDPQWREYMDTVMQELAHTAPELTGMVTNLNSITRKVDSGQGTMGQIINNDDLLVQLEQTLRSAGRTIDDLRETAPITTFSSLIFQAFQ